MKFDFVNPNLAKVLKYFGWTMTLFVFVKSSTKHNMLRNG